MGKFVEELTLVISTDYAKEKDLENKEYVSIVTDNLTFPAVLMISKKTKEDPTLLENGCIPDCLKGIKYTIEPVFRYLWCERIVISLKEMINDCESLQDKTSQTASKTEVPEFPDTEAVAKFLKKQIVNFRILLRTRARIKLEYLSQKFIFVVKEITECYYPMTEEILKRTGFRSFEGTEIFIEKESENNVSKNRLSFKHFGGYDSQIKDLKDNIQNYLEGRSSVSGILISGISGTGKSYLCNILADVYGTKCSVYGSEDILSPYKGEAESFLKKIFEKANKRVPYLIVIDNIDEICCGRDEEDKNNTRIVNAFLYLIDSSHNKRRALVIATASKPDKLDQALRRPGRLSHDITLNIPDEKNRLAILQEILNNSSESETDNFYEIIASKTSGFVAGDLMKLIAEATSYSGEESATLEHYIQALTVIKPAALKNISTASNSVSMDDIVNCETIKTELIGLIDTTLKYKHIFIAIDIPPPTRILLFGPTGCGKTMITQALANHFNLKIIVVKRANVFGKYFGESEKNLNLLFEQAEKSAPCILHFENLASIAGRKSSDAEVSNDVEGRVINHLKVLLESVKVYENIYVIAETNRPDLLDQNVIRHGRFDTYVFVNLPMLEDRRKFLELNLKTVQWDLQPEASSWSLDELAKKTKGFSVAEVILLCNEILSSLEEKGNENTLLDSSMSTVSLSTAIEDAQEMVKASNTSKIMRKNVEFAAMYCKQYLDF